MKTLLLAEHLFDGRRVHRDWGVVFEDGRILEAGHRDLLTQGDGVEQNINLGRAIILPGLVNAHVHLELSDCVRKEPFGGSFIEWIKSLPRPSTADAATLVETVQGAVARGIEQSLGFGVTSVGDVTAFAAMSREVIAGSKICAVSFGEILAMATRRGRLQSHLVAALDQTYATARLRCGVTPHAPYSVETTGYAACLRAAEAADAPLATHLAENAFEAVFLESHTGPFRELWDFLGAWDDHVPRFKGGPIRMADALGLLDYPTLLAHVNYADDMELEVLSRGRASVVYCPRTHGYFGHPRHRFEEMLERGINVAVGTDSCASSPDLNLVDDLRWVHRERPALAVETLWEMATWRAARALQLRDVGEIKAGYAADFCVFDATGQQPLLEILENEKQRPLQVWAEGRLC